MPDQKNPVPPSVPVTYVTAVSIKAIEERHNKLWQSGVGPDAVFHKVLLGWFLVTTAGTFHFGTDKPDDLAVGDTVEIRFRRKPRPGEIAPVPSEPAPMAPVAAVAS